MKDRRRVPNIPIEAHYESSALEESADGKPRPVDPNMRKTPKPRDKRKSRKLVP